MDSKDFIIEDGKRKATKEFKKRRFMARYNDFFPFNIPFKDQKRVLNLIKDTLIEYDFNKHSIIICEYDLMKPSIAFAFLALRKYVDYRFFNAHRLVDVYVNKDEEFTSVEQMISKYTVTYLGFSEFHNRRQSDFLSQLAELCHVKNKTFWLYYKGRRTSLSVNYSGFYQLALNNNYNIIEIEIPRDLRDELEDIPKGVKTSDFDEIL